LQTDGYEVYAMYENKKGVLPIGCWAHNRRYQNYIIIKSSA
jgi:transposase